MIITKDNGVYTVTELKEKWKVTIDNGAISISVDVPKELCATFDELREYVLSNELF